MAKTKAFDEVGQNSAELIQRFKDPVWGAEKLKDISLFGRFTDDELAMLYSMGRLINLKPKSNAVIEGESTRGLYLLLYGRVSVYKTDPVTGSLLRLAMLEEGANFGELSLFDNDPRSATVAAEMTCYLFLLEADSFNKFLTDAGDDLSVRFFKTCAEELAVRFRRLNSDYINSQQLLWKHALRRSG